MVLGPHTWLGNGPLALPKGVGGWWLSGSVLDLDFANSRGYNSTALSSRTPDSILTYTSPSPKLVYGSDGVLRYAPHNLFLNSGAPATQNVTLITGFSYTVTVTGSGSLAGSSGASGTASAGSPATFVATGTTGTFTLTGSLTTIQINRSPAHAGYIPTTSAAVYSLPIDHNPTTFAPLGVLIEEQRTNLLQWSQAADNAAWSKSALLTVNGNNSGAPNGTATFCNLTPSTTNTQHYISTAAFTQAASALCCSAYFKANGYRWVRFAHSTGIISFDTLTGTIGATSGITSSGVQSLGNGVYRAWFVYTASAVSTSIFISVNNADNTGTTSFAGDGTSGVFVWGAQAEQGAFPTSYIPTVASQVTRAADQVSILTSAFGFNATAGTMVASARPILANSLGAAASINDGTGNEEIVIYRDASGNLVYQVEDGGANQLDPLDSGQNAANLTEHKMAVAWAANDFATAVNGNAAVTDTSGTLPTVTTLEVGVNQANNYFNGTIKRLTYFPTRRTDADLQVLTT